MFLALHRRLSDTFQVSGCAAGCCNYSWRWYRVAFESRAGGTPETQLLCSMSNSPWIVSLLLRQRTNLHLCSQPSLVQFALQIISLPAASNVPSAQPTIKLQPELWDTRLL